MSDQESFISHLIELRQRLVRAVAAVLVLFVILFLYPDPVEVDPATLSDDERETLGVRRLPATQEEALDALEADDVLMGALGPVLAGSYLTVRRSEWETYSAEDEAFEQQGHFEKY